MTGSPELPLIDKEPNDRVVDASALGAGGRGQIGPGDVDYYRLDQAPERFRLAAESDVLDSLRLDLVTADESLPESLEPNRGFEAVERRAGTYLAVRSVGEPELSYELVAEPLAWPDLGTPLAEPNSRRRAVRVDRLPARLAGFYDGPHDRDAIELSGSLLRRQGGTTVEVSPLEGARPALMITSAEGHALANVVAAQPGEGVGIPNLAAPEGLASMFIEVYDVDGRAIPEPYTLSLHSPTVDSSFRLELEPNDSLPQAQPLQTADALQGFLHQADDVDVFALPSTESGSLTVTLIPDRLADLQFRLVEGERVRTFDDAAAGEPEMGCGIGVEAGAVVEVSASRGAGTNTRYLFDVRLESPPFEREPNDDPVAALQTVRGEMRGYIYPPGDVDVFVVETGIGAIGQEPVVEIEVTPPARVNVAIELVDERGGLMAPAANSGGPGVPERLFAELDHLTAYRLIVRGVGGGRCSQPYTVEIR